MAGQAVLVYFYVRFYKQCIRNFTEKTQRGGQHQPVGEAPGMWQCHNAAAPER
jgi:hypothetical protein